MIIYCSHCDINWASLWTDQTEDNSVDICPECKNDMHLEPGNDIIAYIKCPFTGVIKNTTTGATFEQDHPELLSMPVFRNRLRSPRETREEKEVREDAAIVTYQETGDKKQYHQTIKKYK